MIPSRDNTLSGLGFSRHPVELPVGAVIAFAGDLSATQAIGAIIAEGWLPCDGRLVQQAEYRALFRVLGLVYTPTGDPAGSFRVPDYRGQFFRGIASDAAQDPGLASRIAPPGGASATMVGSTQPPMVQGHAHEYGALNGVETGDTGSGGGVPPTAQPKTTGLYSADGSSSLSGEETRPQNIYVNYLVKASRARVRLGVGVRPPAP
ncbi:phage tail protein [Caulobacter sp. SL161]|uniref:phage tail protein n=1 Tax=Caulobacter sp. SL161 TaxID=2995156 RepID=UPI0022733053|nr:phage tail protein [Caulobacter sp. SL161]MCY1649146.1 phage tail protein [Caulobacter sp. SL161]